MASIAKSVGAGNKVEKPPQDVLTVKHLLNNHAEVVGYKRMREDDQADQPLIFSEESSVFPAHSTVCSRTTIRNGRTKPVWLVPWDTRSEKLMGKNKNGDSTYNGTLLP